MSERSTTIRCSTLCTVTAPIRTQPAAPFGRIGSMIRNQAPPLSSRAVFATKNSRSCPTGFFVGKAYRLPASTDGPRQIVSHSVLERATNVPFGRTGSGFGA